ncbi:MAG: long-chain fatty acid--CoA ligase [Candidatus Sericytochromatia bacterium]|nr:long-chain fatty acid--CoA ligase [Candidatus Tanganyikabacteria bacterium]
MPFGDWLAKWARYAPEKVALVDDFSGRRYTYLELANRADRAAAALQRLLGIEKGDRIAILALNCPQTLELVFAAGKIGAIVVPLNYRLTVAELAYIVADAAPKAIFYGPEFEATAREILREAPVEFPVPFAGGDLASYEDLVESPGASEGAVRADVGLDDPHLILYTSGTTGRPKGAVLTHGTITWNAVNTQVGWDLTHDDVTITHTPFFHTGGLNVLTTPLLHRGGRVVLMRAFDAAKSLSLIERERATVVFAVPTMFQLIADLPEFHTTDLSSLRFFITGGAPCPVSLIETYSRRGVTFKQGYGLTEAGPNCFTLDARDAVRKAGSVGFPNMHVDVRVVADDGRDANPGEVGELLIRGPHLFGGYWRNPDATAQATRGGWLHTGDLVRRDEEGYTYIVDRKKDMYISGGENVYPAELERILHGHPHIADVAIIGVPDAKWGEVGLAVVVPAGQLSEQDVLDHLDGKVARYKLPKAVTFATELPRNAGGKVLKAELRKRYATGPAPAPHPETASVPASGAAR